MTASSLPRIAQLICVVTIMLVGSGKAAAPTAGRVEPIASMSTDRAAHQATLLNTGEVLITGGCGGMRCDSTRATADLYDPNTGSMRAIGRMAHPRSSHAAVALPDGRVLLAGGFDGAGALSSAELYDPSTRQFTLAGDMTEPRISPVATALPDGRVLLTGGEAAIDASVSSVEIFDPATGTFSAAESMHVRRMSHAAVALADGTVLIVGGHSVRGQLLGSAEVFDPTTGDFRLTGSMAAARHKHAAVLMSDGRVLVVGGSNANDFRGRYSSTELYDPATGEFSPGPDMTYERHKIRDAVVALPSNQVLVAGGAVRPELLGRTGSFAAAQGELSGPQMFATATLLRSGAVLILGGYDEIVRSSSSAWLLHLPGSDRDVSQ